MYKYQLEGGEGGREGGRERRGMRKSGREGGKEIFFPPKNGVLIGTMYSDTLAHMNMYMYEHTRFLSAPLAKNVW